MTRVTVGVAKEPSKLNTMSAEYIYQILQSLVRVKILKFDETPQTNKKNQTNTTVYKGKERLHFPVLWNQLSIFCYIYTSAFLFTFQFYELKTE